MEIRTRGALGTALCMVLLAPPVLAEDGRGADGERTVVEKLLDIMRASGQITGEQYEALHEQARAEQAAAAGAVLAAAASGDTPEVSEQDPTWNFKWKNGFKLERSDGALKLGFGGRIMVDSAGVWESGDLADATLSNGDAFFDSEGTGVEFRRARIFFAGTLYDRLIFKAQYEFAHPGENDNTDFKDVWLGFKNLGPIDRVQIGHFKEPVFLQEWTSSKYLVFMERGLNSAFFNGRNMGLMAMGNLAEKRAFWQLGGFRQTNDQGFVFDDFGNAEWDVTARLVGTPLYGGEGSRVVHLGASYSHQWKDRKSSKLRYRERPESHLATRYVDTRVLRPDPRFPRFAGDADKFDSLDLAVEGVDLLNAEFATVLGPFSAQAEWTGSWVARPGRSTSSSRRAGKDAFFWGAYGFVSYFLTGEHRHYELGKGRFGRVQPKANFDPTRGEWGAWEVAARFSYLDLDDRDVKGGRQWDVTAGLNWYLSPNLRFMLNYVHFDLMDRVYEVGLSGVDGSGDIVQSRFQIDF